MAVAENIRKVDSLIGSEFVNFISTIATCRIIQKGRETGLLKELTYGELMEDLSSAWRKVAAPEDPRSDDGYWVHTLNKVFEELEALNLSKPAPKPVAKKRGRPKKKITESKPKRPRGRPRKNTSLSETV